MHTYLSVILVGLIFGCASKESPPLAEESVELGDSGLPDGETGGSASGGSGEGGSTAGGSDEGDTTAGGGESSGGESGDDTATSPDESPPYNEAIFRSTHNSYSGHERGSIVAQLDAGIRQVEFDFHDNDYASEGFRLGHSSVGSEVETVSRSATMLSAQVPKSA